MSKPDRMSWASPYLQVNNVEQSLRFYNAAFGFDIGQTMRDDTRTIIHAEVFYKDSSIMMGAKDTKGHMGACPVSMYLYCDDVDVAYAHALKHGATSVEAPKDMFYGERRCSVKDIDGYQWYFAC